ncbi:hypothetical protein A6R68_09594, partial [Neotoma lepida]
IFLFFAITTTILNIIFITIITTTVTIQRSLPGGHRAPTRHLASLSPDNQLDSSTMLTVTLVTAVAAPSRNEVAKSSRLIPPTMDPKSRPRKPRPPETVFVELVTQLERMQPLCPDFFPALVGAHELGGHSPPPKKRLLVSQKAAFVPILLQYQHPKASSTDQAPRMGSLGPASCISWFPPSLKEWAPTQTPSFCSSLSCPKRSVIQGTRGQETTDRRIEMVDAIHKTQPTIFPRPPLGEWRPGDHAPLEDSLLVNNSKFFAITTTIFSLIFITIITTTTVIIQRLLPGGHKGWPNPFESQRRENRIPEHGPPRQSQEGELLIPRCAACDWIHTAKDSWDPSKLGYRKIPSEEQAALCDALKERLEQEPTEENDRLKGTCRKREHIRKLRDLGDHLDEVHKACSTSNVMSSLASIASVLLGLALGPITGGVSLLFSEILLGLGAAAGVTSLITTIVEETIRVSDEAEARCLVGASLDIVNDIMNILLKFRVKLFNTAVGLFEAWTTLRDQIQAIRATRTSFCSGAEARNHTTSRKISAQSSRQSGLDLAHKKLREFEQIHKALQSDLPEDLKCLITEDGAWKAFVEAGALSSEEEAALHDALEKCLAQEPIEEKERLENDLQKKRFLEQFPELKRKLEEHIKKLIDLADHLDEVHKGCTISNVVSSSVSIASGVLGLALAPFTGGASMLLSATSLGLGAAAGVTGLTTSIVEESSRITDEDEARRLVGASQNIVNEILKIVPKFTVKLLNTGVDLVSAWKTIGQQIRAIRVARASSRSGTQARNLRYLAQGSEQVGSAVSGSARSMTRGAKITKVGISSFFIGLDLYHLVTDSKDLSEGATTESGGALRDLAHKLEEKLKEFEQLQKDLQSDLS